MKVAAYQAPLLAPGSMAAPDLIASRVRACEVEGIAILCCPEAILGGLADQPRSWPKPGGWMSRSPLRTGLWVIRADIAGQAADLSSAGSSSIVNPHGTVVRAATSLRDDMLVATIDGAAAP